MDHLALMARQALFLSSTPSTTPLPQPSLDFANTAIYPTSPLQQAAIFMCFFFPAVAFVIVTLRIYNRIISRSFGWDDGLIISAMVYPQNLFDPSTKAELARKMMLTTF